MNDVPSKVERARWREQVVSDWNASPDNKLGSAEWRSRCRQLLNALDATERAWAEDCSAGAPGGP